MGSFPTSVILNYERHIIVFLLHAFPKQSALRLCMIDKRHLEIYKLKRWCITLVIRQSIPFRFKEMGASYYMYRMLCRNGSSNLSIDTIKGIAILSL